MSDIVWRCDTTGNPVGTDTRMVGADPCACQGCRAKAEVERLKAALAWEQKQHLGEKELISEIERLRAENDHFNTENEKAWNEIERLRTQNAELKEARRNLEVRLNAEIRAAGAEIERLRAREKTLQNSAKINGSVAKRLKAALQQIDQWSRAYPLKAFPEPNWQKARILLEQGGMTLDAVSASNMRHVVNGVGNIARAALEEGK